MLTAPETTTEATPTLFGRLRTRFRNLMREHAFPVFYAQLTGFVSCLALPMLYGLVFKDEDSLGALMSLWSAVPPQLGFAAGFCFMIAGMIGCGLIGACLGFLTGDVATGVARRHPGCASPLMFVLLLLPFVLTAPGIWILNEQAGQLQAVLILILSLLMSAVVTFGFRLNGWPGPMSDRPAREVWREYLESRRRRKTS